MPYNIAQLFGSRVGNLIIDATTSEVHRKTNRLTDHPIEEGANVTDHIQQQPEEIEIVGIVSNDPVVWLGVAPSPLTTDFGAPLVPPLRRSDVAYTELRRIMDDGELVDVFTTTRKYENMAITDLPVSKDAGTGNVFPVNVTLRELIKVETKEVAAPVTAKKGDAAPVGVGKVIPKEDKVKTTGGGVRNSMLRGGVRAVLL